MESFRDQRVLKFVRENKCRTDLRNQQAVADFFKKEQPEVVIDAAAKVGGILANNGYQYDFLIENLYIQNNLIDSSHQLGVKKFIFLGSMYIS